MDPPAPPTESERARLLQNLSHNHRTVAEAIAAADIFIICTGAGWSAPSGLPLYGDVAGQYGGGTTYQELCDPGLLADDPELFYGFWGGCYHAYTDSEPHAGYATVLRWRRRLADPNRFFCLTTNVDGHWRRAERLPWDSVEEFNGTALRWRCARVTCARALASQNDPACPGGCWRVPPGFRFRVDASTRRAQVGPPARKATSGVLHCTQPHASLAWATNHPRCVRCGGSARPAVKMFNDSDTYLEPAQQNRHGAWLEGMEGACARIASQEGRFARAAVFEVGAGPHVGTLRHLSARIARELSGKAGAQTALVRVNPEFPLLEQPLYEGVRFVPLMEGALEALGALDSIIVEIDEKADRNHTSA